jgi:hypothetical protein
MRGFIHLLSHDAPSRARLLRSYFITLGERGAETAEEFE